MYKRYNIALRPNRLDTKKLKNYSKKLSDISDTFFTLDRKNFFSHVTIYSPQFPIKNLIKIQETLDIISKKKLPLTLQVNPYTNQIKDDDLHVILYLEKTNEVKRIHDEIISRINHFRDGKVRDKYLTKEYQDKLEPEQIVYINKFGFPRVYEFFHPHISLAKFKNIEKVDQVEVLLRNIKEITFNSLGIFTMGDYGVCKKLIYST